MTSQQLSEERVDQLVRALALEIAEKSNGRIEVTGEAFQPRALPERLAQNFDPLDWRTEFAKSRETVAGDACIQKAKK